MTWQQITCHSTLAHRDTISDTFEAAGAASVTYQDAEDQPVLEPAPGETPMWDDLLITALFPIDDDLDPIMLELQLNKAAWGIQSITLEKLEDQEWVRAWMDNFHPMQFGDNLWVYPSWHDKPEGDGAKILLDPGLAFGTGTHPTTALCLEWLGQHQSLKGKTVLDYGCGSGILALAALMLGAEKVVATDIDPQALIATQDNAQRNGIAEGVIHTCYPDEMPQEQFDIVLANILAGPLVQLAPTIAQYLSPEGDLVLSGILAEQADNIRQAYDPLLVSSHIEQQEDWIRLSGVVKA